MKRSLPPFDMVSPEMAEVLRQKTGAERLAIADAMYGFTRRMLLNYLRSQHPDWDDESILREAARRLSHGAI
jgi:hypothetical protein